MARSIDTSHFVAQQNNNKHTGVVIFLHGAGDTGPGVESWTQMAMETWRQSDEPGFCFENLIVTYPTAPQRKYTADRGRLNTVWFDWPAIDPNIKEDLDSIDNICGEICLVIQDVIKSGIPPERIILGGLSMGGVVALHIAYRFRRDIKAVFALSTFLHNDSIVYEELKTVAAGDLPPLYQTHGVLDQVIQHDWGRATHDLLCSLGVTGEFHSYPKLQHSMCKEELLQLRHWVNQKLP